MQNVEFKAELRHPAVAMRQCEQIGAEHLGTLRQIDTYYRLTDGRLKKRACPDKAVEWIFYHRPNEVSPRISNYTILADEEARRRWGTHSLKPWVEVVKKRELWLLDNVRIHIDEVERLGAFIEFEAIVSERCPVDGCRLSIAKLREAFQEILGEPISVSYSDLLDQL